MSDLDDPTDVYEPDEDDVLRRPLPPRTWRDRLDDLASGGGPPARIVGAGMAGSPTGGDEAGGLVDINRASAAELEELPGVGPATAEAIIAHREQSGPFASVDDLIDVRGIGDAKLEQIRPQATV